MKTRTKKNIVDVSNVTTSMTLPETGFMRIEPILELFPVGRSSWWEGVRTGRYPPAVKLGPRTTAWRVEDIRALIDNPDRGFSGEQVAP